MNGHKITLNSNSVLAYHYPIGQSIMLGSNVSHQQKPDSDIHRPPTNELDCITAQNCSHEMLTKIENQLPDLELRSIHMSLLTVKLLYMSLSCHSHVCKTSSANISFFFIFSHR